MFLFIGSCLNLTSNRKTLLIASCLFFFFTRESKSEYHHVDIHEDHLRYLNGPTKASSIPHHAVICYPIPKLSVAVLSRIPLSKWNLSQSVVISSRIPSRKFLSSHIPHQRNSKDLPGARVTKLFGPISGATIFPLYLRNTEVLLGHQTSQCSWFFLHLKNMLKDKLFQN